MLRRPVTVAAGARLAELRAVSERAVLSAICLHGPALALTGWCLDGTLLLPLSLWFAISCVAVLAHVIRPNTAATRATLATALCLMPALLVEQLSRHPWQADAHMHFFAVLAITAVLLDRGAILAGATTIALHHIILNYALPQAVFPGRGDLGRVAFHALIVVIETTALCWLVWRTTRAIAEAEAAGEETVQLNALRVAEQSQAQNGPRRLAAMQRGPWPPNWSTL